MVITAGEILARMWADSLGADNKPVIDIRSENTWKQNWRELEKASQAASRRKNSLEIDYSDYRIIEIESTG
jgi:hypothetical protein